MINIWHDLTMLQKAHGRALTRHPGEGETDTRRLSECTGLFTDKEVYKELILFQSLLHLSY